LTGSGGNARKYALTLLGYRGRSERELRDRLKKKGFDEGTISDTILFLEKAGYLDDHALAENLKRQAITGKFLGYSGAKRLMLQRGVPRAIIDATLDFDESVELENIQKLMDKKCRTMGHYSVAEKIRRLRGFLIRKGYSPGSIRKALKDLEACAEEEEGGL
jgi:regulatory protein